jgi:hypothetical protein
MTSEEMGDGMCKMATNANPAYFNIVFDVSRYIHNVTLVGNPASDYGESKNWFVTVGSQTGALIYQNTEYGKFVNHDFDRKGKEIKVGAYGKSVGVYRPSGGYFSFRWIAVFSTASDCSGAFDWSGSRANWRIPITTTS